MTSFRRIDPSDVETFTVVTNPIRTYSSSSTSGPTGSVHLFARRSHVEKDPEPDSSFVESAHDDAHLAEALHRAQWLGRTLRSSSDPALRSSFSQLVQQYMQRVNSEGQSLRKQQQLDVVRFTPPAQLNSNTLRKLVIKDNLQPFYRTSYPSAHWAYTNYSSLNFFTASGLPTSSVLLYPNVPAGAGGMVFHQGYVSGTYTPSGSFSFDFYVNPRYQPNARDGRFKAGTLLHLSSTYALSLVSGSAKDENGRAVGYRLQLQLSHSADVAPSRALPGAFPSDLIFLSDDNSLQHNSWHHVVVRWGTRDINGGRGTFNIDGKDRGTFTVPSSTIAPQLFGALGSGNPDVLCVGNYYEGTNNGASAQALFFANDPALRDGLQQLVNVGPGVNEPQRYAFNHPLNAEVHDLAVRRCYMSDDDIAASSSVGPTFLDNTFALYVPPFFVSESPYRRFVGDHGGILVTPFQEVDGSTTAPFSVALSFGIGGHLINLENYVRDFASNVFPRLHHLTASAILGTTQAETANQFLYSQPFVAKRNLTIMPCDDGLFVPSFQLLASETLQRAVDDLGLEELSFVHLDDMVHSSSALFGPGTLDDGTDDAGELVEQQVGHTPESPFVPAGPAFAGYVRNVVSGSDVEAGAPLTVYQRTLDGSSNQVTVFDVSNVFYGFRIKPGTLRLTDASLSGSSGAIGITLADDGRGNVYRADCITSQSTWASVGNVYYDEGIVVLKSPHVFFFGQDQYVLSFRGEQHVHVMRIDAIAPNNQLNSSSNPSYASIPLTNQPNDPGGEFVYISGINLHDADLNVVMKSQLAQPIAKRVGDRILFKIKYDF